MKRLFLALVVVCGVNSPVLSQDVGSDIQGIQNALDDISWELGRMNRNGVSVRRGGSTGGMFGGTGPFYDTALDPDGNIVHWSYYAPGMHEKRMAHASRVKRAQAKKAKTAARRAAMK